MTPLSHLALTSREESDLNAKRIVSVVLPMSCLGQAENGSTVTYGDNREWVAEIWNMDKPYRSRNVYVRLVKFKRVFLGAPYCLACGGALPDRLHSYCRPCATDKEGVAC